MSFPPLPPSTLYDAGQCLNGHNNDALRAYGQACREAALEVAATICDSLGGDIDPRDPDETRLCANSLAHAIRSLK